MYRDSAQAQPRGLQWVSRHRSVDTGKANHSDPHTRPPQGGCILYFFCRVRIRSTVAAALFSEPRRNIL